MPSPEKSPSLGINWEQLPELPAPLSKHPCAVHLKGRIYVGGATDKDHAHTIFEYNLDNTASSGPAPTTSGWTALPRCPRRDFGMVAIDDVLVIVGGVDSTHKHSSKVTLWDQSVQQWKEGHYPSLLQARANPHVITYKNWLLVIGGVAGSSGKRISSVEKFDIESHKPWMQCPPLPDRFSDMSAVVVEHTLYVAGSCNSVANAKNASNTKRGSISSAATMSVTAATSATSATSTTGVAGLTAALPTSPTLSVSVSNSNNSSNSSGSGGGSGSNSGNKVLHSVLLPLLVRMRAKDTSVWEQLPSIPNAASTICSVSRKSLLAFGGETDVMSNLTMLSPVYSLRLDRQEGGAFLRGGGGGVFGSQVHWKRVGSLPYERNGCTCLCVSRNKIVLLGGTNPSSSSSSATPTSSSQHQEVGGLRRVDVGVLQGQR